jgi:7-cyano-7-deazaguanine synthase
MPGRAVVILSGGLDSTVLLYSMIRDGYDPIAVTFNYGQKHSREIECAKRTCQELRVPHRIFDLTGLAEVFGGSSLTSACLDVPEGHYQAENMKSTVVPNRNSIMLNLAMGFAIANDIQMVAYGAHSGDHAIYPDCREEFVEAIQHLATLVDYKPINIVVPFLHWTKAEIVEYGVNLNVSFNNTYSCYKGGEIHCGKCGTCTERKEAFALANVEDPTEYDRSND